MRGSRVPAPASSSAQTWAPALADLRLLGDGRSAALLSPDATVQWWCAPEFDDPPLCWRLLDPSGGSARFPELHYVDADDVPAAASATTLLRDDVGVVEVRDGLLSRGDGVALVRLLRRRPDQGGQTAGPVEHALHLGGFEGPPLLLTAHDDTATGTLVSGQQSHVVTVRGGRQQVRGTTLITRLDVTDQAWTALVIGVDADARGSAEELLHEVAHQDLRERRHLDGCRLPRAHPQRALDALAVLRACTSASGAVVASLTTSLPEAPGHDRQFDYRYTWLRDASLSTAVAALLGKGDDARRHLDFVLEAWADRDLLTEPVLDVRGGDVPDERDVEGVTGWAGSAPVRVGNGAKDQRQYDSLGLLAEAVFVYLQVGGSLDDRTWELVRRLADQIAEDPGRVEDSNGIWELRQAQPLVDGDIGRWLLLDRALWIARGWRPWVRRRHWKHARAVVRDRIVSAIDDRGLLPQAYGQDPPVPDASALMAVAFGLLPRDDPRAGRLVDALLDRLGAGPYLYRYPPGRDDGFSGTEGAFLPMSFLAVTALAQLGRVQDAELRLDRLCAGLPRLLSEEVDPQTGQSLGNTPLVWSHAELARAIYVLDAAKRRARWGTAGSWAWRLQRYVRLRHDMRSSEDQDMTPHDEQEVTMQTRVRPAGPPASSIRPGSGGVGRGTSPAAEAVSDALRRGSSPYLDARRRTVVLQTAAAGTLAVVGLYQFGVLRSVPGPSLAWLDAGRVDASGEAHSMLRTPDASLGIASAGLLLATVPAVLPEARAAWRSWRTR